MPNVLLDMPQDLLDWLDSQVESAKQEAAKPFVATLAQQQDARLIAKAKGLAAANEYYRSLRPAYRKTSRRAVIVELLELARTLEITTEIAKPKEAATENLSPQTVRKLLASAHPSAPPKKPGTSAKKSAK